MVQYKLADIARNENIILFDTSAKPGITSAFDLLEDLSSARSYRSLDLSVIKAYRTAFRWLRAFVSRENVMTIPEVTKEMRWLVYKLEDHKKYYDAHKHRVVSEKILRNVLAKNEFEEYESFPEQEFKDFSRLVVDVYKELCCSLYIPRFHNAHSLCNRLVCCIEEHGKCKKPYKYFQSSEDGKPRYYLGTDEKLIGTALYNSFVENRSSAIITGDRDFLDIFKEGVRHIFSEDLEASEFLLEQFAFFPVSVYVRHGYFFDKTCGMDLIGTPPKYFGLVKMDHRENVLVRTIVAHHVHALCRLIADIN